MKFKYLLLLPILLCIFSCTREYVPSVGGVKDIEGEYIDSSDAVPGWIRIKLSETTSPLSVGVFTRGQAQSGNERIDEVAASLGATEIRRVFKDGGKFAERRKKYGLHLWYDVKIDENIAVSRAGKAFAGVEGVELVEPIVETVISDYTITPDISVYRYESQNISSRQPSAEAAPFDDPLLSKQWSYYNDGSIENSVAGADINVFPVWRDGMGGSREVIVAIIDGGIQFNHLDLAANMWINGVEIPDNGKDDDGNGYIDDIYGWNAYTESGIITPNAHGTHVAGTVAAVNNNNIGVCGVAGGTGNGDGVRLMSCQGYVTQPNGSTVGTIKPDLFAYASDNGAVIAQCSWGYPGEMPTYMKDAILYFIDNAGTDIYGGNQTGPMKGGVVCFAAGNSGNSTVEDPSSMDEVVSVTAMDPDYKKSVYSNYGDKADIFAPGGARVPVAEYLTNPRQIYSTSINDGYAYLFGTSMAAPHVSGVAALIVSYYGVGKAGFTAAECKRILLSSYRPLGEYIDEEYAGLLGVGLLDASLMLQKAPSTAPDKPNVSFTSAPDEVTMKFVLPADGYGNSILKVNINYYKRNTPNEVVRQSFINIKLPGEMYEKTVDLIGGVPYVFNIAVEDRYGNVSEAFEGVAIPLPHINIPPTAIPIDNVLMFGTSASYVQTLDLSKYFVENDEYYGDYLTYMFVSSAPEYVDITIEGTLMTFKPIYKGESFVEVTATDSFGESVKQRFKAIIFKGNEKPEDPEPVEKVSEPDKAVMSVYPNPVVETLNISFTYIYNKTGHANIYDGVGRKLIDTEIAVDNDGRCYVSVDKLTPGTYTIIGEVLGREFKVPFVKM